MAVRSLPCLCGGADLFSRGRLGKEPGWSVSAQSEWMWGKDWAVAVFSLLRMPKGSVLPT